MIVPQHQAACAVSSSTMEQRPHSMLKALLGATLLTVSLAWGQGAHAGLFSDDDARKSVYDLRADVLQRRTADDARFSRIESNLDNLQQANNRLQQSIDRLDQTLRNLGLPALQSQVDGVSADAAKLRGSVEMQTNLIEQEQKRNKEFYLDLDNRLRALEKSVSEKPVSEAAKPVASSKETRDEGSSAQAPQSDNTVAAVSPAKPSASSSVVPPPAAPSVAEQKSYDQAYQLFKASNYLAAIKGFQAFSKSYPRSTLSANASFWQGMSQYRLKAYTAAESALREVATQFPDSPKAPDALLNLASVQLEAGNASAAHDSLDELINRYPASEAAAKAKARLGRK